MKKILYIIRGCPGSGKSTFAKELVGGADYLVCEADKFFINKDTGAYEWDPSKIKDAHEWCRNNVEAYMKNDQFYPKFAVSNTFTQEWEMEPYFELAKKYGYTVFSVVVENRHGGVNIHNVPDVVVDKMKKRFEFKL